MRQSKYTSVFLNNLKFLLTSRGNFSHQWLYRASHFSWFGDGDDSEAYDTYNQEPLFYEQYPGGIVDISQLQFMFEKANGYGYNQ